MLRRIIALGLPAAVVGASLIASAAAATTSERFPIDFVATDCPDNPVHLTGTVHGVLTTVENANGTVLVSFSFNPQGVTGVGLVNGLVYHGTGVTRESQTFGDAETHTFVNNFRLISPGRGGDVMVQQVFHVTLNANGEVTATQDRTTISCT